jgi:hypothetical protein
MGCALKLQKSKDLCKTDSEVEITSALVLNCKIQAEESLGRKQKKTCNSEFVSRLFNVALLSEGD